MPDRLPMPDLDWPRRKRPADEGVDDSGEGDSEEEDGDDSDDEDE